MNRKRAWAEPFKIKMVEHLKMTTRVQREAAIVEAGYNPFLLNSEDVYIDLLTDSGTSAMSDQQWAGLMLGDESYAGSHNYRAFENAVKRHYGYKHVIPTHQGRGAEHLLSRLCIKPGQVVPGNMYFTTTRAHQELAGGEFIDVVIDEAHDPNNKHPFKGNVDLDKLQRVIDQRGADRIAYLSFGTSVNMAGGQPISMASVKVACGLCHRHGIRVYLDATRAVENCYFIRQRESGYGDSSLDEILLELCSHTDGCTVSAKKDCLTNIGGFLAINDEALATEAKNLCVLFEGLHTRGGLTGRDLQAIAIGISESLSLDHMRARIGQVLYLGEALIHAGIPIVRPIGGHGVFIDAGEFLPHVPRGQFPAQALVCALYVESGVRAMERGAVSAGRDKHTGQNIYPKLELVRLTIPRRMYTQAHMDVTADSVIELFSNRHQINGLQFIYEPKHLRFFQARFKPVSVDGLFKHHENDTCTMNDRSPLEMHCR